MISSYPLSPMTDAKNVTNIGMAKKETDVAKMVDTPTSDDTGVE